MSLELERRIDELWQRRDERPPHEEILAASVEAIDGLDSGVLRVAEVVDDDVIVHEWLKRAILLCFTAALNTADAAGPFEYFDKVPLKTGLGGGGVRVLPGAIVRWGAHVESRSVLMPSFVNIGARVGSGTMVDTWATVGSCAQIGRNVHLSGGVGIGGVLEPSQAPPVIIEDDAFIGSRSMITEGARVGRGAMLGAGVILKPSIPVIDAETGDEVRRGIVPAWSLVVNATRPRTFAGGTFGLPCALILKRFAEGERHDKAALNDMLGDHGVAT